MKRFLKQATAIALLAVSIFAVPSGNTAIAALSNCTSVKKTYPFGIALNKTSVGTSRAKVNRTKYIQLKYLDKDLDGIVCETEKLQTKVTTSSTTVPRTTVTTVPRTTVTTVPRTTVTTVPRTTVTTTSTTTTSSTIPATTTTTTVPLSCASGGACSLGDTGPGGGIVFYVASSEQSWGRYLEAARSDISNQLYWETGSNQAQGYRGNDQNGWRLPTKDELNLLYVRKSQVGGFSTGYYWSASETSSSYAWAQDFSDGHQENASKGGTHRVRPIRAFSPITTPVSSPTTSLVSLACASGGACSLGDTGPGGGIVFYVASSEQSWGRYLEAARSDISNQLYWETGSNQAQGYRGNDQNGWRLPTKDELNLLYVRKSQVGGFSTGYYWSASETSSSYAWAQDFSDGHQENASKGGTHRVRPIRAF